LVVPGQRLKVEKLDKPAGDEVVFDEVLLTQKGEKVELGNPLVTGAQVKAQVLNQGKAKKVVIVKYKAKARYHKKTGHRQPYTEIEITNIK